MALSPAMVKAPACEAFGRADAGTVGNGPPIRRRYKDCRTSIEVIRYSLAPRLVPLLVSNIVSGS